MLHFAFVAAFASAFAAYFLLHLLLTTIFSATHHCVWFSLEGMEGNHATTVKREQGKA